MRNYCGLLAVDTGKTDFNNRYINRIMQMVPQNEEETVRPLFAALEVEVNEDYVEIVWQARTKAILNIPVLSDQFRTEMCSAFIDGTEVALHNQMKIRNQYGWVSLYQTDIQIGSKWMLRFYK